MYYKILDEQKTEESYIGDISYLRYMKMNKKICILLLGMVLCVSGCTAGDNNKDIILKEREPVSTFIIDTPFAELLYPEKWQNAIRTEEVEKTVEFYGSVNDKEALLFSIGFTEGDGYLLGTLGDIPVYINEGISEFDDSWTDDEQEQIITMQEDVNVILDGLMKSEDFHLAQ